VAEWRAERRRKADALKIAERAEEREKEAAAKAEAMKSVRKPVLSKEELARYTSGAAEAAKANVATARIDVKEAAPVTPEVKPEPKQAPKASQVRMGGYGNDFILFGSAQIEVGTAGPRGLGFEAPGVPNTLFYPDNGKWGDRGGEGRASEMDKKGVPKLLQPIFNDYFSGKIAQGDSDALIARFREVEQKVNAGEVKPEPTITRSDDVAPKFVDVADGVVIRDSKGNTDTPLQTTTLEDAFDSTGRNDFFGLRGLAKITTKFFRGRLTSLIGNMRVFVVDDSSPLLQINGKQAAGYYDPNFDHIVVSASYMADPKKAGELLIHEGSHGAFWHALRSNPLLMQLAKA
jgi:hypothetical protein